MSEKDKPTIWEASPTRWLLFPSFIVLTLAISASIIGTYSYFGKLLPSAENTPLHGIQVFISKNEIIAYGIWVNC